MVYEDAPVRLRDDRFFLVPCFADFFDVGVPEFGWPPDYGPRDVLKCASY